MTPDRELAAQFLRTRDEVSFRALFRAHSPALLMLALRMLGGAQADAEDAIQETWIRAIQQLPQFRWESSLRTWLCGIAINCCREVLRRRKPSVELDAESVAPKREATGLALDLESALRALPDGYREVLVLHDVEGYTHEEVSSLLGITSGTSKSQLSRARATMRRWLHL